MALFCTSGFSRSQPDSSVIGSKVSHPCANAITVKAHVPVQISTIRHAGTRLSWLRPGSLHFLLFLNFILCRQCHFLNCIQQAPPLALI
jgi:hypothetical protein